MEILNSKFGRLAKNPDPFNLKGMFLAGGSILSNITRQDVSDYDYYPKSNEALIDALFTLLDDKDTFVVNISDRAITFKSNLETNKKGERAIIQIMTYDTFETAEKIFQNFDFTVCMGAFDCDSEEYSFHQDFFPDIASKTIRVNVGTKYPLNSLIRTSKYREKGYYVPKTEHIKLAYAIAKKGLPTSWEELEQEIGGTYGKLISLDKENKEYTFENVIEVLDNTIFESYATAEEDLSSIEPETLELLYSNKTMYRYETEKHFFVIDEQGFILYVGSKEWKTNTQTLFEELLLKKDIPIWNKDYVKGYKLVGKYSENTYIPGTYSKKDFYYKLNEETIEEKHPHIFVFYDPQVVSGRVYRNGTHYESVMVEIETKIDDIVNPSYDKHAFITKKVKVTKQFEPPASKSSSSISMFTK